MNPVQYRRVSALALPLVLLHGASAAWAGGSDSTIHFAGEIVAAPYQIVSAPAPSATFTLAGTVTGGGLIFRRQGNDRPSASIQVQSAGGHPLDMVFADSRGNRKALGPDGTLAIGQDGGSLELRPASLQTRSAALVTVLYD